MAWYSEVHHDHFLQKFTPKQLDTIDEITITIQSLTQQHAREGFPRLNFNRGISSLGNTTGYEMHGRVFMVYLMLLCDEFQDKLSTCFPLREEDVSLDDWLHLMEILLHLTCA